ncbi:cystathionine beta-lyase [Hydrogenophaga palleronii]|uniref:cystathionine beta-lyase n=1 Tax=Hydrogenophaga palleronii TaxID=65655 RepID=UPI000826C2CF|nr:cystathionine beta-lyase [Hydrogenophaga palleronii]
MQLHLDQSPLSGHADTSLAHIGRDSQAFGGLVNVPVCRGSTILSHNLEQWEARKLPSNPMASYGRFGNPNTRAFEESVAQLEGGHAAIVFPSGLAACTTSLLALVRTGDHVLLSDSVYGPTRQFALSVLARMGVEVEFFDPCLGGNIRHQVRSNTRVVFLESPGSMTFEVQDTPAIAEVVHGVGGFVVMDNTWATPLYFQAFEHGVDISIQSATKYIVGHSDALLGVATANRRAWDLLRDGAHALGQTAGPDDLFLALRGLRTLSVRLRQHEKNALHLAHGLLGHPAVAQVLHPALPDNPGHALWKRDFKGSSGLFGLVLKPMEREQLSRFFLHLRLFGIGLSWGGFESLALPVGQPVRSVSTFSAEGPLLRIHAGLENAEDLLLDFTEALHAACCRSPA